MHWMSNLGSLLNSVLDMSNLTVEARVVWPQIRSVVSATMCQNLRRTDVQAALPGKKAVPKFE